MGVSATLLSQLKEKYNTKIICITPFRDERWMLHRFLSCALLWADHIILGDNDSVEPYDDILSRHDKSRFTLLRIHMEKFNESAMRQPLLEAARKIPGRKLLVFLDADEVLSGNILDSPELETMLSAPEGTVLTTNLFQMNELVRDGYIGHTYLIPMLMDDGVSEYDMTNQFHGYRIPGEHRVLKWDIIKLNDIAVVHYGPADKLRVNIKLKWYQLQEWLQPNPKPITVLLRQYYIQDRPIPSNYPNEPVPERYFKNYLKAGVDMSSLAKPHFLWQEKVALQMLLDHSPKRFDVLDVWDHNWTHAAIKYDMDQQPFREHNRSLGGRLLRCYIRITQKFYTNPLIRLVDSLLDKAVRP